MAPKVYFTDFCTGGRETLPKKLARLIMTAGFDQIDFEKKYAAIKIHFGEKGNLALPLTASCASLPPSRRWS